MIKMNKNSNIETDTLKEKLENYNKNFDNT